MIETLPATRIRRTALRTSVSIRAIYQVIMTLYGRIQKQFGSIRLSFLPDAEHHGKYFALCVEPRMHPVMGSLQRVEVKAFDLIVAFLGDHKGPMA